MHKSSWSGGHTESILSLDVNADGILSSGGEDCLCVWTKDGSPNIKVNPSGEKREITSVCFSPCYPEQLYASSETKIYCYDLRNLSSSTLEYDVNEDEINQLAVHDKGRYLAACDDTGTIKVIDLQEKRLFKTLSRVHTNICSTVQFRPHRPWGLVSGGMDYRVAHWDFSSGRVLHEVNVQEIAEVQEAGGYLINPPFVHSVHVPGNGRKVAVGLEDGSIQIFSFEGKKNIAPWARLKKHTRAVCQVHFPRFGSLGDNVLISGGNDEHIIVWKLWNRQSENGHGESSGASTEDSMPHVLQDVTHGSKVNWITSPYNDKKFFVGDQTNIVSLYALTG